MNEKITTIDAALMLRVSRQDIVYHLQKLGAKKHGRDYLITSRIWKKLKEKIKRPDLETGDKDFLLRSYQAKMKEIARYYTSVAVSWGIIKKAKVCDSCQSEMKLEIHHPDYSDPFTVEWLCFRCHSGKHKRRET
jgi:hypothetical protein